TVPSGWTITAGQGTTSITVTAGTSGSNGAITVTAENICGTSSASTIAVNVGNAAPSTPVTIAGNASLCVGATSQTYSVSAVTNATTYSWTVPTGWTITSGSGSNSIVVTPGTAGQNGIITVTAGNACGTSQGSTLQVSVNPLPSVNAGSDTTVCANDFPISLTAAGNATSYSWNTGANTATTTITTAGTYTVTGTLNGCSSSDSVVVISDPCAGIEENSQDALFSVFPNPAQSIINVKADNKLIGDVYTIYDNTGRVILSGKLIAENTTIELRNLSGGIYMFSVGENMKQSFKVIKE
ncbi:MAG: T9SS type A sorting domain-containing protein, partial [Crocinitomicaceae bacterium]